MQWGLLILPYTHLYNLTLYSYMYIHRPTRFFYNYECLSSCENEKLMISQRENKAMRPFTSWRFYGNYRLSRTTSLSSRQTTTREIVRTRTRALFTCLPSHDSKCRAVIGSDPGHVISLRRVAITHVHTHATKSCRMGCCFLALLFRAVFRLAFLHDFGWFWWRLWKGTKGHRLSGHWKTL